MGKYFLILMVVFQNLYGFWPFDWLKSHDPLPSYVLEHPAITESSVYGVGNGKNFLEAKSKALNDISTQLESNVRSITSVQKNSTVTMTQTNQQITVLTKRQIDNYSVIDESHVNGVTYLLIEYKMKSIEKEKTQ